MQNDDMITLNLTREQACALYTIAGSVTGDVLGSPRKLTDEVYYALESMGFNESSDEVKEMRKLASRDCIHFDDWPKKVDPWKEAECRADDLVPGDLFRIMFDGQTKVVLNSVDMWGRFRWANVQTGYISKNGTNADETVYRESVLKEHGVV